MKLKGGNCRRIAARGRLSGPRFMLDKVIRAIMNVSPGHRRVDCFRVCDSLYATLCCCQYSRNIRYQQSAGRIRARRVDIMFAMERYCGRSVFYNNGEVGRSGRDNVVRNVRWEMIKRRSSYLKSREPARRASNSLAQPFMSWPNLDSASSQTVAHCKTKV